MARTDERGGRSSRKSGQRVEGFSHVEPFSSPGCCTARNSVVPSGVNAGPQISEPRGPEESARDAPVGPAHVGAVESVVEADPVVLTIGRDPDSSLRIERDVVGRGEPAVLANGAAVE